MIIKVLFGLRECDYLGQYAPEAIEIIDEYSNDENPSYILDKFDEHAASKEFAVLKIIDLKLNQSDLEKIMQPKQELDVTILGESK